MEEEKRKEGRRKGSEVEWSGVKGKWREEGGRKSTYIYCSKGKKIITKTKQNIKKIK